MLFTKKSFSNFPWKLLVIEGFLVVMSVLLALALNSWRESQSHQRLAQRALNGIVEEVEVNCSKINTVQSYHQSVANDEHEPEGIQVGLLRNQAWDAAKTLGAAPFLDYEIVAKIEEINAHQSDHRSIVKSYGIALFTIILEEKQMETDRQENPEGERAVIRELFRIQETLLKEYHNLSELVNNHYSGTIDTSKLCEKK